MQRYAVVSDIDSPDFQRVGLVVERADRVNLLLVTDYGLRTEFREPYTVTEPDGGEVVYHPGEPEYFDHVLLTLARTFLVADVQPVENLDRLTMMQIFHEEVVSKQPRSGPFEYPLRAPLRIHAFPRSARPNTRVPRRRRPRGAFRPAA